MERCLYDPEHGYYTSGREVFGRAGDYYTTGHTHPIFARILARCFVALLERVARDAPCALVELGAGTAFLGRLALSNVEADRPDLADSLHYIPVEVGRGSMPERFSGIVFSNEFFDALPVRRLRVGKSGPRELLVDVGEETREREGDLVDARSRDYMNLGFQRLRPGWKYEVNLRMVDWLEDIDRRLTNGYVVTIDYGFQAAEYERIERPEGTLLSYYRHQVVDDIYARPGEQDITAHVNFEVMIKTGNRLGWESEPLTSQREFMTRWGLEQALAEEEASGKRFDAARIQELLALKQLLMPGGISDTMRALVQKVRV